jgi:protein-disulfide isomerase
LVALEPLLHEDQIGNADAPVVVTMVSNPHCNPCQQAHQELSDCVAFFEDEMQLRVRHINTGEAKYESHEAFAQTVGVTYTPTIFINGHQLQQPYTFKDIRQQVRALAEQQI